MTNGNVTENGKVIIIANANVFKHRNGCREILYLHKYI